MKEEAIFSQDVDRQQQMKPLFAFSAKKTPLIYVLLIQNSIEIFKKYALFVRASSHELGLFRYAHI